MEIPATCVYQNKETLQASALQSIIVTCIEELDSATICHCHLAPGEEDDSCPGLQCRTPRTSHSAPRPRSACSTPRSCGHHRWHWRWSLHGCPGWISEDTDHESCQTGNLTQNIGYYFSTIDSGSGATHQNSDIQQLSSVPAEILSTFSLRWSWSCSLCHWSSVTDLRPVIAQVRVWPVSPVHRSQDWLLVTGLVTAHTLVSTDWWVGNTRTHVQVKALSIVTHFSFDLFNSF